MIDPSALQQHFKKIQNKEQVFKSPVPYVQEILPLTALQTITNLPEPVLEEHPVLDLIPDKIENSDLLEVFENTNFNDTDTTSVSTYPILTSEPQESIDESINNKEEDYDPYGYYSRPLF